MTASEDRRMRTAEGDRVIVDRLRASGIESAEFRLLRIDLTDLVIGTLMTLHRRGTLSAEIRRQCDVPLVTSVGESEGDVPEMIRYAASAAVPRFMSRYLLGGEWNPDRSSMRSCCVRAGMFALVEEYRLLRRDRRRRHELPGDDVVVFLLPQQREPRAEDPERRAVDRDTIRRLLAGADPGVTRMLLMTADGYRQAEIATALGTTPEAVSSALRRYRSSLTRR